MYVCVPVVLYSIYYSFKKSRALQRVKRIRKLFSCDPYEIITTIYYLGI